MENQRIRYLESIRGLAAMQVLLVHFIEAFLPRLWSAYPSPSSMAGILSYFRYVWEGAGAVYIFFALSGYVLTLAFDKRTYGWPQVVAARLVRLALPAFVSVCFAFLLYSLLGLHNIQAGELVPSEFLMRFTPDLRISEIFRDGILNSALLGYPGRTWIDYVPGLQAVLQPHSVSLNTVVWSLSIEFYGSILIFALCALYKKYRGIAWAIFVLLVIFFARSYFIPFLFGYLMARFAVAEKKPLLPGLLAIGLFLVAVYANSFSQRLTDLATAVCQADAPIMSCMSGWHQAKAYAALIIFYTLTQSSFARNQLSRPFFVWLGALSFPIYLVHFPILLTVSSGLVVLLSSHMAPMPAAAIAAAVGIALSFIAAIGFKRVDGLAMTLSRKVQKAQIGNRPTEQATHAN